MKLTLSENRTQDTWHFFIPTIKELLPWLLPHRLSAEGGTRLVHASLFFFDQGWVVRMKFIVYFIQEKSGLRNDYFSYLESLGTSREGRCPLRYVENDLFPKSKLTQVGILRHD